jgi:hypothetical protein
MARVRLAPDVWMGSREGTQMSLMSKRLILLSLMVVRFFGASDWWASQTSSGPRCA